MRGAGGDEPGEIAKRVAGRIRRQVRAGRWTGRSVVAGWGLDQPPDAQFADAADPRPT